MSVKRITLVVLIFVIGGAFTYMGIADAVKTHDSLDFQKVELKSRSTEIQELNVKYDKLNTDLDKASKAKEDNQQEVQKLQQEKQDLEKQKQDLEAQLQAKIEQKSKLALASEQAVNVITGTATASAASYDASSIRGIITSASNKYGLSPSYMIGVANCESTLNPGAENFSYHAGGGHPQGLYQYLPNTWADKSARAGYGGSSVFDAVANANVTAWAFANGQSGEWACA